VATTTDLLVRAREDLAAGVVRLELAAPDGGKLPSWEAGAHVDLVLEPDLVRSYSLCGSVGEPDRWQLAVQLDPDGRGGSRTVHERLHPGSPVTARGPRNGFPLLASERYLFLAGGIGITPILPMLDAADCAGADWRMVYGGRSRRSMAFLPELERFGSRVEVLPQDDCGLLPLDDLLAGKQDGTLVYCCGPEGLLAAAEDGCAAWAPGSLHLERFAPRQDADSAPRTAFEVELAASGRVLQVPGDRSVLEVLEEAGLPMLSSCREGTCGTCEVGVIAGEVDHRDSLLTPQERAGGDIMFVCVSRARGSRLVLDL
jgi:ferredoxin-NADP reductase